MHERCDSYIHVSSSLVYRESHDEIFQFISVCYLAEKKRKQICNLLNKSTNENLQGSICVDEQENWGFMQIYRESVCILNGLKIDVLKWYISALKLVMLRVPARYCSLRASRYKSGEAVTMPKVRSCNIHYLSKEFWSKHFLEQLIKIQKFILYFFLLFKRK